MTLQAAFAAPVHVYARRSSVLGAASSAPARCVYRASPRRPASMALSPGRMVSGIPTALQAAAIAATMVIAPVAVHALDAPKTLFFDVASVVPKGTSALAEKALGAVANNTGYVVHFVVSNDVPYGETVDEYAKELFDEWGGGAKDIVVVGGVKVARAGVVCGEEAAKLVTKEIADSIGNETYAVRAGVESYGGAVLDVNNRLVAVLNGERDPGPPKVSTNEVVGTYKTKQETSAQRGKYIRVVGALLVIAFVAPFIQTAWFLK
jgi:uncharacterized protein